MHKFVRVNDRLKTQPDFGPPNGFEVGTEITDPSRVIVGVAIRSHPGDITTLVLGARMLNPATGKLEGDVLTFSAGREPNHPLEITLDSNDIPDAEDRVLGGLWARANPGDISSMKLWTKSINENGVLEGLISHKTGPVTDPPNGYEAEKILSSNLIVVSIALRANPGNVTHIKGLYSTLKATVT